MLYNVNRIGGLASGMDIDQMVSDLMKAERMKADKLFGQKQVLEWQKQDFREINLKLRTLYNRTFDMRLSTSYMKYEVRGNTPEGNTIDTYFSATASSQAVEGKYRMMVEDLASAARLEGGTVSAPLVGEVLEGPIEIGEEDSFNITLNGVKRTITLSPGEYAGAEDLAVEIQAKIDEVFGPGKVDVGVTEGRLSFKPADKYQKVPISFNDLEEGGTLAKLGLQDGASFRPINAGARLTSQWNKLGISDDIFPEEGDKILEFKINGKTFSFDFSEAVWEGEGDDRTEVEAAGAHINYSLNDILNTISQDEDVGVLARYDALTDKVVFTSKDTGLASTIDIRAEAGGKQFFSSLGIDLDKGQRVVYGEDASIVFNGIRVDRSTNEFTLEGINFSLTKTTPEEIEFTVGRDIDAGIENIKEYVDLYNETIDAINKKLNEDRHRDYPPLTDAQKADMTENDIKLWEERSRTGMLRSDPMLRGLLAKMRETLYTPVEGQPEGMKTLSSIGIGTREWYEMGRLHIDEDKLRTALEEEPDAVMGLFNARGDGYGEKGVAVRLYDVIKGGMDNITEKAGGGDFERVDNSALGKQIREMDKRISNFEDQMLRVEDRYWKRFAAMEQAVLAMNQQSMWLMTQMGLDGF